MGAPRAFGAEYVGAETCMGCHEGKAQEYKASFHGQKMELVGKVPYEKSCETCHGPGSEHAGAAGDRNDAGFSTIKVPEAQQCLSCHKSGETMLWDIGAHAANGMDCKSCHSVHKSKGRKNLKLDPTETCLQCHKKLRLDINLPSHHPITEGKMTCVNCHNPHGGERGNLRGETINETCFKCHAEKAGPYIHEHPPVSENCMNCHKPHGSQNSRLLKKKTQLLCMGCHKMPHGAGDKAQRYFYNCTDCHRELHGSDQKKRFYP